MFPAFLGAVLALTGLGVILTGRFAGARGIHTNVSVPTRLFVGLALVLAGHQLAAHALPDGAFGPRIPSDILWLPITLGVLGLATNLWIDRRAKHRESGGGDDA